jgi:hypothetical protein
MLNWQFQSTNEGRSLEQLFRAGEPGRGNRHFAKHFARPGAENGLDAHCVDPLRTTDRRARSHLVDRHNTATNRDGLGSISAIQSARNASICWLVIADCGGSVLVADALPTPLSARGRIFLLPDRFFAGLGIVFSSFDLALHGITSESFKAVLGCGAWADQLRFGDA